MWTSGWRGTAGSTTEIMLNQIAGGLDTGKVTTRFWTQAVRYCSERLRFYEEQLGKRLSLSRPVIREIIQNNTFSADDPERRIMHGICDHFFEPRDPSETQYRRLEHLAALGADVRHAVHEGRDLARLLGDSASIRKATTMFCLIGKIDSGCRTFVEATANLWRGYTFSVHQVSVPRPAAVPETHNSINTAMASVEIPSHHPAFRAYLGRRAAEVKFAAKQKQKSHVHEEVQLFFHALRNDIKEVFPYMGASKLTCVLCAEILRTSGIFSCRASHKHFYSKWMVPDIDSLPHPAQEWTLNVLAGVRDTLKTTLLLPGTMKGSLRLESTADMTTVTELGAGLDCVSPELSLLCEKQREVREQQMLSRLSNQQLSGAYNMNQEAKLVEVGYSSNPVPNDQSDSDDYEGECGGCTRFTSRHCGRCGNGLFCSAAYEARMGPSHKFLCSNGPLTTADISESDGIQDVLPQDQDVLRNFGFESLPSAQDRAKLMGLYKGIFYMNISADDLHAWQCAGVLSDHITLAFEQRPVDTRGGYFPWFVENRDRIFPGNTREEPGDEALNRFCEPARFLLELKDRLICVKNLRPTIKRNYSMLAALLVQSQYPGPEFYGPYYDFGFCACQSLSEERALTYLYQELILGRGYDPEQLLLAKMTASEITVSRFAQFCEAYETGQLIQHMDANGLQESRKEIRHLTVYLSGREEIQDLTVWKLLTFLKSDDEAWPPTDVSIDFRFFPCDSLGRLRLKKFYSSLVARVDIIQLQQAQSKGRLLDFAKRYVEVESDIANILK